MSLSFVSSAVLTSSDGVSHNEEKAIDSKEVESLRRRTAAVPLFEQLRSNQNLAQDKYDEMTKAMRGSRTLDEEDCAHLDSIEKLKEERDYQVRGQVEEEVASYKAAKANLLMSSELETLPPCSHISSIDNTAESKVRIWPKVIVGKRKRRKQVNNNPENLHKSPQPSHVSKSAFEISSVVSKIDDQAATDMKHTNEEDGIPSKIKLTLLAAPKENNPKSQDDDDGLGSLLGCYGSDSN